MLINPIINEQDYLAALEEIDLLWKATEESPDYGKLEVLVTLVDAYEKNVFLQFPDPIDALKFHIAQQNIPAKDLDRIFGSPDETKNILEKRKPLTLTMIWELCTRYKIPAESLIKPYELK